MMLRAVVCAVATRCRAYVVCLPFVELLKWSTNTETAARSLLVPPGGDDDFDWHGEDAQLKMGCVFGLELVARSGPLGETSAGPSRPASWH